MTAQAGSTTKGTCEAMSNIDRFRSRIQGAAEELDLGIPSSMFRTNFKRAANRALSEAGRARIQDEENDGQLLRAAVALESELS